MSGGYYIVEIKAVKIENLITSKKENGICVKA
jgi:hypothetical protein